MPGASIPSMRQLVNLVEATEAAPSLYHVSSDPDLNLDPAHDLQQGALGRGFYASATPEAWADTLASRSYLYRVDRRPLRIASDRPDLGDPTLIEWAVARGYMRIGPVVRPDGRPVLDMDDQPMIRPEITQMADRFRWRDPMTGRQWNDLENEYLLSRGFNAYEPVYSRDGHQVIIFDLHAVRLQRVDWRERE